MRIVCTERLVYNVLILTCIVHSYAMFEFTWNIFIYYLNIKNCVTKVYFLTEWYKWCTHSDIRICLVLDMSHSLRIPMLAGFFWGGRILNLSTEIV